MDGIFGVGIGEMIIIALAILVVGGPTRSREWAREAGRILFKLRSEIAKVMSNLEKELGPEGKEIMDTTRQLNKGVSEMRSLADPRRIAAQADKLIKDTADLAKPTLVKSDTPITPPQPEENNPLAAWLPKNNQQK